VTRRTGADRFETDQSEAFAPSLGVRQTLEQTAVVERQPLCGQGRRQRFDLRKVLDGMVPGIARFPGTASFQPKERKTDGGLKFHSLRDDVRADASWSRTDHQNLAFAQERARPRPADEEQGDRA
jgi:hypothetical protein